jgi:uncharacterized membrane protein
MTPATDPIAVDDYPVPVNPPTRRLETVDMLRGLLMVLMALDHTRDYFGVPTPDPTNPLHSWPALFLTRWVTHLCAPGFVALAGTSVYLQRKRGKSQKQICKLLVTRGLWLVFMELTVVDFGWAFSWSPFLQVIWAVGISMVVLGLLQWLPVVVVGAVGAAIVVLHNLLDPFHGPASGMGADLWKMLNEPGMLTYHGHPEMFLFYPALAWIGVICLGYAFGPVVASARELRRVAVPALGLCLLAAFSLLRIFQPFHGYGDSYHFQHLATTTETEMSFWQVQKYPPSLDYVLATFGVLLLIYAVFDWFSSHDVLPRARHVIETYGRVPFFYYVLHIYLLHAVATLVTLDVVGNVHSMIGESAMEAAGRGWGVGLPAVYAIWLSVVVVLYWPSLWFSRVKARRRDWWISYL